MIQILTLSTIILFSYFSCLAQIEHSNEDVLKTIERIKVLNLEDNDLSRHSVFSEGREIRYVKDQFTKNKREECLAIVPMEVGRHYAEWIIFMYKNAVDITDVDNDGIKEIITESSGMAQGYFMERYRLFSIKNGSEEILHQNESFDNSVGHLIQDSKQGDTISTIIEVNYIDLNNDGLKK